MAKKLGRFSLEQRTKVQNLLFPQFPVLVIQRDERIYTRTSQVMLFWITKKSQIIIAKFLFAKISFVWIFFTDTNFVIFITDFFWNEVSIYFVELFELKPRFQQPVLKKYCVKILIKQNPLNWFALHIKDVFWSKSNIYNEALFPKLINGSETVAGRNSASVKKVLLKFI